MNEALTPATIATVKATVPAIAQFGTAITTAMYARLFQDEHIRALFNQSNQGESGAQVHALAAAILGYAQNIDNLGALAPVVERIAYKHVGYHILPEHYPFVANALLGAIREVLGEAATDEVLAAWGEAYWFLANILKAREAVLRDEIMAMRLKVQAAHPVTSHVFDVKHSRGGMVDAEFAVQCLVLTHAAQHPSLVENRGNITLLRRAEEAGLLAPGLGEAAASAYRQLRRVQHQARLNESPTHVAQAALQTERDAILALWAAVFSA